MSLKAMSAPRSSVFTFESTVHSSHVLGRLDEQRRRDTLCDVTVVVEGQSFRAHRSVLASCSEYFTHRISSLTQQGAVISLPQEVSVAGFEPLLKFAYTSKLLFGKDDVLEVRNSASILGFRDLDEACFEFLLPKFSSSTQGSALFPRKTCCKKNCKRQLSDDGIGIYSDEVLLDEKAVKPVAESPFQQEEAFLFNKSVNSQLGSQSSSGTLTPVTEETNYIFQQGPKYRKFQLACGKETCFPEKSVNNPLTVISNDCDLSCSPCCSSLNIKNESEVEFSGNSSSTLVRQSRGEADDSRKFEIHDRTTEADIIKAETDETSTVEREVAEHLVKCQGSDWHSTQPNFHDGSCYQTGSRQSGHGAPSEWPHVNLSFTTSCPFIQDLDQGKCLRKGADLSECEGASQSGVSSFNSGEDGDTETETEGDSEAYTRERARQMQLPFSVDWIVDQSRNEFQQLLKTQEFTREQLEFVHDMRRRSKNRLAAQRCRKRKLDCIYNLQCEINKLKTEREKLITERSQLSQLKLKTCHNVTALCQKVCSEADLQPDQLQVLAKYTSPDCPLSTLIPHIDTLLSQPELQHRLQASLSAPSMGPHQYGASEQAFSSSSKDAFTGDGPH
uniref:BTB and CNC homology 1, basic leucine zipper transcription factor 1 b n=1 Tax=Labrus bergylta TaxID=56723 RepID=A0A3Q3FGL8_9LABR